VICDLTWTRRTCTSCWPDAPSARRPHLRPRGAHRPRPVRGLRRLRQACRFGPSARRARCSPWTRCAARAASLRGPVPRRGRGVPAGHCGRRDVAQHASAHGPRPALPGAENSGRLVILLKTEARALPKERGLGLILCDGAPGIGCPVISSLSGWTWPWPSPSPRPRGHDLERVAELCAHFRCPWPCWSTRPT
jgi:hypothetical protein